jgi:hypothetical protein
MEIYENKLLFELFPCSKLYATKYYVFDGNELYEKI